MAGGASNHGGEQLAARNAQAPALLSYGFRPFFLAGSLHAALLVAVWVPWYLGMIAIPSALPPLGWHAYELLFGFVPAIIAGFLLTAVPSWTGRRPVAGLPLLGLVGLWLAGQLAVALSASLPPTVVAALALAFLPVLAGVVAREIVAARNWRNLKVLAGVALLAAAQALAHYELWHFGAAAHGDRLGLAAILMLILIIGGRIVPGFTGNWLRQRGPGRMPAPTGTLDRAGLVLAGLALAAWTALPALPSRDAEIGLLLVAAGLVQAVRQARWAPERTGAEPLVAVLHAGHAFVPLGFVLAGWAALQGLPGTATGAVHAWTVGAIGLMTLAVMTRASRGHTGRPLKAPAPTVGIYACVAVAAATRIAAAWLPGQAVVLLWAAAAGWVAAFLGFAVLYGPALIAPRLTAR